MREREEREKGKREGREREEREGREREESEGREREERERREREERERRERARERARPETGWAAPRFKLGLLYALPQGKDPGTHFIGGLVDTKTALDAKE